MKLNVCCIVAALFFASISSNASASIALNSKLNAGVNTLQDQDFERVLRPNGSGGFDYVTGDIQVGDILEAALSFDFLNASSLKNTLFSPNYQFTAYSRVEVVSVTPPDVFGNSNFVFKPAISGNVAIEVYENSVAAPLDFLAPDTAATSILDSKTGQLVATFGFVDASDFWVAKELPASTATLASLQPGVLVPGQFFFGLSIITNNGFDIVEEGVNATNPFVGFVPVDLAGGGQLKGRPNTVLGPGIPGGWDVETDTTVAFRSVGAVPEPAAVVTWLVLAAVGTGGAVNARLRRRALTAK